MPSAVTLLHSDGVSYIEVRPSDVEDCLNKGFKETDKIIPDINHNFVNNRHNRHLDRDAIILGNGPSIKNYPKDKLSDIINKYNLLVIGCNNMFDLWGNGDQLCCDYWVILDKPFWDRNYDKISQSMSIWDKDKTPVLVLHFDPQKLIIYERIVIDTANNAYHHSGDYNPNIYPHGKSSGVAALFHALHMGCKNIYLLGHDLTLDKNGNTHSHGIRDSEIRGYTQGENMLQGYDVAAIWGRKLNRNIYNLSPISIIPSFLFVNEIKERLL